MGCAGSKSEVIDKKLPAGRLEAEASPAPAPAEEPAAAPDMAALPELGTPAWEKLCTDEVNAFCESAQLKQEFSTAVLKQYYDHSLRFFGTWPRGSKLGELMPEPLSNNTPVAQRGVSVKWLKEASNRAMSDSSRGYLAPTRVAVSCVAKVISQHAQCALFDFVPPEYRGKPTTFLSHALDGTLHNVLNACAVEASKDEPAYAWIDVFAINQWSTSTEVGQIGQIVEECNNTVLLLPGMGEPARALYPLTRSWCIYEVANTPDKALHVRIPNMTTNEAAHNEIKKFIHKLSLKDASAKYDADKEMIDRLVLQRYGSFDKVDLMIRTIVRDGYYKTYLHEGRAEYSDSEDERVACREEVVAKMYSPANMPLG